MYQNISTNKIIIRNKKILTISNNIINYRITHNIVQGYLSDCRNINNMWQYNIIYATL